jgi:uncharacterized protein YecE (DUF72 family)
MNLQTLSYLTAIFSMTGVETTDLKDGFLRIETSKYVVEIPKGWEIGEETSFGQREFHSKKGELGTMTGGSTNSSWDQLYRTSLYFVTRSVPGKPTPYKLGKSKSGYETMSFEMQNVEKKPTAKYVIFKNTKSEILALSVRITDQKNATELEKAFDRMINTAKMK